MAERPTPTPAPDDVRTSSTTDGDEAPLDDVMIAMDIVDTLRHDEAFAERELDETTRRTTLIERLREIYRGQGIDVPDRILEEGVDALEEQRFSYTPPKDSWARWFAHLYVTRFEWGRLAAGIVLGTALVWSAWYGWVERPRTLKAAAERAELAETLPATLKATAARIAATGADATTTATANQTVRQGLTAAMAGDRKAARAAKARLDQMLATLSATYTIRLVTERGASTGFSRVPRINTKARNYYLVVEAVDATGTLVPQEIVNEETGKRERVRRWGIRVSKSVYDRVRADKADDGIVQDRQVAIKRRGRMAPDWKIETLGGTITRERAK